MNHSTTARRIRSGLIAGAVLAMGLMVAPARAAATPPPVVQGTSLSANNTWSKIASVVSVDYNRIIDVAASSATMTDGAGLPITGLVDTPFVIAPVNNVPTRFNTAPDVLYFDPQVDLTEEDGPYTVTFTARSIGQDPLSASTVATYTFRVDVKKPLTPTLANQGTPLPRSSVPNTGLQNPVPAQAQVLGSTDAAQLAGIARDTLDSFGNEDLASGISKVTLHFFHASSMYADAGTPTTCVPGSTVPCDAPSAGAVETKRIVVSNACQAALCPTTFSYTGSDTTLAAGYWTVRASTEDLAGNVSGQSDPVAFVVVKA